MIARHGRTRQDASSRAARDAGATAIVRMRRAAVAGTGGGMMRGRTIGLAATLILGMAASAGGSVRQRPFTYDRSHRTGTELMREILVADATMGGARVTGFRLDDRCRTTIATDAQSTTIDWSTVTNILSRSDGGRRIMTIERGGDPVVISVAVRGRTPTGDNALQLESGFGLLANACGA